MSISTFPPSILFTFWPQRWPRLKRAETGSSWGIVGWPKVKDPHGRHLVSWIFWRHIWVFPKIGIPQNGWFIMENPVKIDELGEKNYFWKHPYVYPYHMDSVDWCRLIWFYGAHQTGCFWHGVLKTYWYGPTHVFAGKLQPQRRHTTEAQ